MNDVVCKPQEQEIIVQGVLVLLLVAQIGQRVFIAGNVETGYVHHHNPGTGWFQTKWIRNGFTFCLYFFR